MELDFVVGSASLIRLLRGGIRVLCNEMLVWSVPREAPLHLLPESEREDDLTPHTSGLTRRIYVLNKGLPRTLTTVSPVQSGLLFTLTSGQGSEGSATSHLRHAAQGSTQSP